MKSVLITGGAKRLGEAFARALAEAGWTPVIHYNASREEAEALASSLGGHAVGRDLSALENVESLIDAAATAAGGPLSGLVNSASIFEHDDAGSVTPQALLRHFAVNTAAPVLLSRRFAAQAPAGAAIVNVLDQKLWNPNPDHLSYTLAKAALREATTLCAQAYAPTVRVVGVAPGYALPGPGEDEAAFEKKAAAQNPLGRRLEPKHVADAVRFALENPAVTGTVVLADNGEHLVPSARDVAFKP
ncbi:SDR family oxidoreductase [Parvularcula dongshanensis]|uniref:NAD(P)-dependent dehydrogenase (Short-subunit alcohol dehydrogenase family) n=1 Tax=Parvularcula dongshanensis TaxID=1173995 RepID=A0A840I4B4_9PROT|nr:NAD(P)-dependent dehydrogenase (short-subunit alcohol dehydrogenase family) [Parvularcula dongshanensis]